MTAKTPTQASPEPLDPFGQNPHYLGEVAKLQSLLARGKVEEARRFAGELEGRWPDSDLVRRFVRVLAPPVARVVQGRKGMSREQTEQESTWLREHAREYPGCWVVLDGDRLIAAHPRLRTAMEEADRRAGSELGSLHYIRPRGCRRMMPPCTGRLYYQSDREQADHTLLVAVPCRVGSLSRPVFALLDTASEWCVLPHDLAVELGAELELLPAASSLHTRFGLLTGTLGRLTILFDAADGEPLAVDAICFTSEGWPGPMVVGWKGCLERMRMGLDPSDQSFYFGAW